MKDTVEARQSLLTIRDWIRYGASEFNKAQLFFGHGTDNPWDEALALVLHALKLDHSLGGKILDCNLLDAEKKAILELYQSRIIKRIPVPYLTHKAFYGGFEFYVDERVLIPRSPILELIEQHFSPWIEAQNVSRILDIGTGSACIPIVLAHYYPEAQIDAVDIDVNALAVARKNVSAYGLDERIRLIESDLFSELSGQTYDIIITNPPYVDADEMAQLPLEYRHEPRHALASGNDGLQHMRQILQQAHLYMNQDKSILVGEVGLSQQALQEAYPHINFIWLDFERGGEGVFLLNYDEVTKIEDKHER